MNEPFHFMLGGHQHLSAFIYYPLFNQVKEFIEIKTSFPRATWPKWQHKQYNTTIYTDLNSQSHSPEKQW